MQKRINDFFKFLGDEKNLQAIHKEVEEATKATERKHRGVATPSHRRGQSQLVLDKIHELLGDDHEECRNAEGPCLNVIVRKYMTKKNASLIIDTLEVLLPNLYFNRNTLSVEFSKLVNTISNKFPGSDIEKEAQNRLHLEQQAAKLRRRDYEAQVYRVNNNLRPMLDTQVLEVINKLQYSEDWPSLTLCVGLAVGSRLNEILMTSAYERAEHRNWITVRGVSKAKRGEEKLIVKPIVGGIDVDDIISMVGEIRSQFGEVHDIDLGTGVGDRKVDRKKVTSLASKSVNDKIREEFGPEYLFHDSRALYAELAFAQFAPTSMSKAAFFSNVLGHREESLTTALSYQKFALKRKLPEGSADILSRMTTLEAEMRALKKLKQEVKNNFAQAPNQVSFLSLDGNVVTYNKQPHIRDKDDVARMNRLISMVIRLTDDNVKTTHANLSKLGFGSRIINMWSKGQMPEGFVQEGSQ